MTVNQNIAISIQGGFSIITKNIATNQLVTDKCFEQDNTVTKYLVDEFIKKNNFSLANDNSDSFNKDGLLGQTVELRLSTGTGVVTSSHTNLDGTLTDSFRIYEGNCQQKVVVNTVTNKLEITDKYRVVVPPADLVGTFGQVGLYDNAFTSTLYAGQQLKDVGGNPATVTFLDTEEVTVVYTLKWVFERPPVRWEDVQHLGSDLISYNEALTLYPVVAESVLNIKGVNTTVKLHGLGTFIDTEWERITTFHSYVYHVLTGFGRSYGGRSSSRHFVLEDDQGALSKADNSTSNTLEKTKGSLETVLFGTTYKGTVKHSIAYNIVPNTKLKAIWGGWNASSSLNTLYDDGYGFKTGIVVFDPAIPKGAGDEFNMSFSYTVEFTI